MKKIENHPPKNNNKELSKKLQIDVHLRAKQPLKSMPMINSMENQERMFKKIGSMGAQSCESTVSNDKWCNIAKTP